VTAHERWWLYLISSAAAGLTLGLLAIIPALPAIKDELGIPTSQVGWFATVYLIPTVVLTLPAGLLAARVHPKLLFAPALIVYAGAGMVQAAFDSYGTILALRAVQGMCVALAMPLTITIIADVFEHGRQIRALSIRQICLTLAGVAWPLVGTTLATITWKAPFLAQGLLLPIGLVLLLRPPPATEGHSSRAPVHRAVLRELRDDPLAMRVLLLNFARYFFLFVVVTYVPVLLVVYEDHSLTEAGLLIAGLSAVSAVASERMEWIVGMVRPGTTAVAACLLIGIGIAALGPTATELWAAFGAALLIGIGDVILGVLADSYTARLWQAEMRRAMAATVQTLRNAGKLLGPLAVTALLWVGTLPAALAIVGGLALVVAFGLVPLRTLDTSTTQAAEVA
jgi:ACDE family multidrug resistance protein